MYLKGMPVVESICEGLRPRIAALAEAGITPTLAIVRVGEREDDLAYERSAVKRLGALGLETRCLALPADTGEDTLLETLEELNRDAGIDGVLLFRPLPAQIDDAKVRAALRPEKDVDGITEASLGGVFTGSGVGFAPCTAEAVMALLRHYGIPLQGRRAVVLGRSLVIGRPVAQLLLAENATVTVCHRGTVNLPEEVRRAELVIAALGRPAFVTPDMLTEGQVVVDVGIHPDAERGLVGDVSPAAAEKVQALTPVPGGLGTVTTAILAEHLVAAAERAL